MNLLKRLTILLIFFLLIPFVSLPLFALEKKKAVVQDTFFVPMRLGEAKDTEINIVNTSKKASRIFISFIEKSFPKGDENKWFAKFCMSDLCYFDNGESAPIRSGESFLVKVGIFATEEASINQISKLVLEVYPTVDKSLKTIITIYAVCIPPKEIKLTIGEGGATIIKGRTMVPLRFIGDNFGAETKWDSKTQQISFVLSVIELTFQIGKNEMQTKIGPDYTKTTSIDPAPTLISNRTHVPLRVIAENIGATVLYDPTVRLITIYFPAMPKLYPTNKK